MMKVVRVFAIALAPMVSSALERKLMGRLFDGFEFMLAGQCNPQPDGCLNFADGWYMYEGEAGTSTCRTTCIPYPGVRPELKCGRCEDFVATASKPAPLSLPVTTPLSPLSVPLTAPIATMAPVTVSAPETEAPAIAPGAPIAAVVATAAPSNSPINTVIPTSEDNRPGDLFGILEGVVSDWPSSAP